MPEPVASGGTWRDGVLFAIGRLDRLALAHAAEAFWEHAHACHDAAAALREELKIAEGNAA